MEKKTKQDCVVFFDFDNDTMALRDSLASISWTEVHTMVECISHIQSGAKVLMIDFDLIKTRMSHIIRLFLKTNPDLQIIIGMRKNENEKDIEIYLQEGLIYSYLMYPTDEMKIRNDLEKAVRFFDVKAENRKLNRSLCKNISAFRRYSDPMESLSNFEQDEELILILNEKLRIETINGPAYFMTGFNHDELLDMTFEQLIDLETKIESDVKFEDDMIQGLNRFNGHRVAELLHKDGNVYPVEILMDNLEESKEGIIFLKIVKSEEIAMNRTIERKSEFYRNRGLEAEIHLSEEGIITKVNQKAIELLSENGDVLVGKEPSILSLKKRESIIDNESVDFSDVEKLQLIEIGLKSVKLEAIAAIECLAAGWHIKFGVFCKDQKLLDLVKRYETIVEEKENWIRAILNSSPDLTFIYDRNGNYLEVFARKENHDRIMTNTLEKVIGKNVSNFMEKDLAEQFIYKINLALDQKDTQQIEYSLIPNGEERWFNALISPIAGREAVVCVARDITESKIREHELHIANEDVKASNDMKGLILSNLSHEIRTPLNAILGMTTFLKEEEMSKQATGYLKRIDESGKRLMLLLNNLLDLSEDEALELELEQKSFNLYHLIDVVCSDKNTAALNKGLRMMVDIDNAVPEFVMGDRVHLEKILVHLLDNAVKFTGDGEIVLKLDAHETQNDERMIRLEISDTGIGISKVDLKRIFNAFEQVDGTSTRFHEGLGLGLTLVNQFTRQMGGELSIESTPGKGTTVMVVLPIDLDENIVMKQRKPIKAIQGANVLVVDDNATSRVILTKSLESFTFKVDTASNGVKCLEYLRKHRENPPAAILMDWNMPGMSGVEVVSKIKNQLHLDPMPKIIMVSAHSRPDIIDRAKRSGVDGYLIKPVSHSVLFDAMINMLHDRVGNVKYVGHYEFSGAKVLVVDDNVLNRQVAKHLLESMDVSIHEAENGMEAIEAMRTTKYELVFMDAEMPVMDGYTATRLIRRDKTIESVPIVALTANTYENAHDKLMDAGMQAFLTKPLNPERIEQVLVDFLPQEYTKRKKGKKPKQPQEKLAIPYADVDIALSRLGGDHALYLDLIRKFIQDFGGFTSKYALLLKEGRREEAMALVHTFKGLTGNLAFVPLYDEARRIEKILTVGDDAIDINLHHLEKMLKEIVDSIEMKRGQREALIVEPEKKAFDRKVYKKLLNSLEASLQTGRIKIVKNCLSELEIMILPEAESIMIADVKASVDKYQLKDALNLLNETTQIQTGGKNDV